MSDAFAGPYRDQGKHTTRSVAMVLSSYTL